MGCSELSAPNKVTCPFIFICFILYPSKIPSLLLGLHPLFSASSLHLSPTISISTIPSPFRSLSLWLWRCAVAWWRRQVWNTQVSTGCRETTPWCPTCRSISTRAWTSTLQRRCAGDTELFYFQRCFGIKVLAGVINKCSILKMILSH